MPGRMEFLNQSAEFWIALQERFEAEVRPNASDMLEEIVMLRGKVAFYESRIAQMADVMRPVR